MRLNETKEPEAKRKLLASAKADNNLCLRLFFQARNMAIAILCREIEDFLDNRGLPTVVTWKEDSRMASIQLALIAKDRHERYVGIKRDAVGNTEAMSRCFYSLNQIQSSAYYRYRKPKIAEKFDEILGSPEFAQFMADRINDANYPFPFTSHSSV